KGALAQCPPSFALDHCGRASLRPPYGSWLICGDYIMSNDYEDSLSTDALNDRIAILEDNIRQLIEQAAAASGEQNESRIADRINQQNDELERLMKERDARLSK